MRKNKKESQLSAFWVITVILTMMLLAFGVCYTFAHYWFKFIPPRDYPGMEKWYKKTVWCKRGPVVECPRCRGKGRNGR